MIGADDWRIFADPAVFGRVATLTAEGRPPVTVAGVLTDRHATVAPGDFGGGVSTVITVLTVAAADLPAWLTPDRDTVEVGGVRYIIRDARPDGTGLSRLILERAF